MGSEFSPETSSSVWSEYLLLQKCLIYHSIWDGWEAERTFSFSFTVKVTCRVMRLASRLCILWPGWRGCLTMSFPWMHTFDPPPGSEVFKDQVIASALWAKMKPPQGMMLFLCTLIKFILPASMEKKTISSCLNKLEPCRPNQPSHELEWCSHYCCHQRLSRQIKIDDVFQFC